MKPSVLGAGTETSWSTVMTHKREWLPIPQERKKKEVILEKAICEMAPVFSYNRSSLGNVAL